MIGRVHGRVQHAILVSDEVLSAILIGSAASGTGDAYSDLDYFIYAVEPNWPRMRMIRWLQSFGLEPSLCYWSGVEKYHMVINDVGVDLSVRAAAQRIEARTWPTIHFPESAILKDTDGVLRAAPAERDVARLTAGHENTLHGCLYHAMSCAIQLRRGELVNARSRFSGVIEAFLCVVEGTTVGNMRWREPSRRLETRMGGGLLETIRAIAYAGAPSELRSALGTVLDICEQHGELSAADRHSIERIRALLREAA